MDFQWQPLIHSIIIWSLGVEYPVMMTYDRPFGWWASVWHGHCPLTGCNRRIKENQHNTTWQSCLFSFSLQAHSSCVSIGIQEIDMERQTSGAQHDFEPHYSFRLSACCTTIQKRPKISTPPMLYRLYWQVFSLRFLSPPPPWYIHCIIPRCHQTFYFLIKYKIFF